MGFILDTDDDILGLERRRESYNICDLERKYPHESGTPHGKSEHIFTYQEGEIEMSNEFLLKLLQFFEKRPEERQELEKRVGELEKRTA